MTSGVETTPYQMGEVRRLAGLGVPIRQIAARQRISKSTVERILKNRTRNPERAVEDGPVPNSVQELNQLREEVATLRQAVGLATTAVELEMDVDNPIGMMHTVVRESRRVCLSEELAWGIIAKAYGGDWEAAPDEWKLAAEKWRDEYKSRLPTVPADGEQPIECDASVAKVPPEPEPESTPESPEKTTSGGKRKKKTTNRLDNTTNSDQ